MREVPATVEGREAALADFIDRLVGEVGPLMREHNLAMWSANTTGERHWEDESARLDAALRRRYSDAGDHAWLRALGQAGGVVAPLLARQLRQLTDTFTAHQISPSRIERMVRLEKGLEGRFNNFRATVDGMARTDNELREVLRVSDDADVRRRAWEGMKQVGPQVRDELIELVRLRNEAARGIGYPDYYRMMLELDELDESWLSGILDQLEEGTRPLFEGYKGALDARLAARFATPTEALRPWHYSDPFFQEAPAAEVDLDPWFRERPLEEMARRSFAAIGLDIDPLLARADLHERPGKCQHAFCLSVDRGDDVRVLCNLRPNEHWMATLLHEMGHAVYDVHIDRSLPFLLRAPAHTLTTEASAMLFGRLSKDATWLERHAGMPGPEARAAGEACTRALRGQLLVQTRWMLVMCRMERELYRDPGQDLDTLWWDLVERYQWVRRPEGRRAPDWASKLHFSVAPVYYQNYMLGEMMATQIERHLRFEVLDGGAGARERYVTSPEVGRFLRERLYHQGRRRDWRGALEHATGGQLRVDTFVAALDGRD